MVFPAPSLFRLAIACGLATALATAAHAAPAKKPEKDADPKKPVLLGTYGDWNVYQSQAGKGRLCYTLAQPKSREPAELKRDPAYAFISQRPSEHVRNEVSFIMGFEIAAAPDKKDKKPAGVAPTAVIGDSVFELLPKGGNLWVKNAAQESQLIQGMRDGVKLEIKALSKKGKTNVDVYSLTGFSQAIDKALKECPGA